MNQKENRPALTSRPGGIILFLILSGLSLLFLSGCTGRDSARSLRLLEHRADRNREALARELKLDEEQKQTLDRISQEIRVRLEARVPLSTAERETILSAVSGAELDTEALEALLETRAGRRPELLSFLFQKAGEFHQILSPEQREILAEWILQRLPDPSL